MAITTTMVHKIGRNPGTLKNGKVLGHPSSQNVIETSVSKKACQKDGFAYRKGKCIEFAGSHKEEI